MFDYQSWLYTKFANIIDELEVEINFILSEEQQFVNEDKKPDTLYIVWKQLVGPTSYGVKSVNCQILLMSENNSLEIAKAIANKFAEESNFNVSKEGNTIVKHSYSQPAVLSNFNQIDVGSRSIVYIPGSLQVMEGLKLFKSGNNYGEISVYREGWVDNQDQAKAVAVKYLSIALDYSMVGDTQQFPSGEISKTIKSTATVANSLILPLYDNNDFINDLIDIYNGTITGNTAYTFSFSIGDKSVTKVMKVISVHIEDAAAEAPGIRIGLQE